VQLVKQAHTIRKWSTSQVNDSYAQNPFSSLIEDDEPLLEPDSVQDQQMLILYKASLELTEAGISTVMAPTVARRFKTALDQVENCAQRTDDAKEFNPFYEELFKEAMEAYTIYGRMESIVCEMEILIDAVLKVLDDDSDHGFQIVTGKMIGVGLAPDEDEQKTNIIMERVFGLLAALTAEAKSFNYMAWLQAMGESDMEVTEIVEEFIQQKQEIRKLLWISNIEADEFLTSRLLVAAMTFAKWFDKMRKAADEFEEFLLKQYAEDGHYGYYKLKQTFQKQSEERKRWAIRLQEKKEACKREAHESHGKRIEATLEMRREREAEKEEEPPPISGLPISDRSRKSRFQTQINKSPSSSPMALTSTQSMGPSRRFSWSSKRSSHMEEQIMTLLGHARQHLDELQLLVQEQKIREQKAFELLLRMLMKSRVLERRKLRKATTQNISQRVNSLMPGRFVVMHTKKSWSAMEDFDVTSSLLQQQAICKTLNDLTVNVELKDIWTGVEGKFLMKNKKKAKPKKQALKSLQTQEQKEEAAVKSKVGNLWGKARDSMAAGSAVSAILGIQATKEAEAQAAHEERLRAEAEARAAEAEANDMEMDEEDLFNFPPHLSLVDVQLLLSDAAVTRTEKLRELRQDISKTVQEVGAQYGRQAWDYNAQSLQAYSNYNAWAALMPVVEKEMMSLGESGRFFLSRQDAANLQDLMRMMRSIKSQLAVETANRTNFEDDEDRWTFNSEVHIRALIEHLRNLHITLNERKQKAAKLDIRAELTQELAHLHPELRSTYGLVQKHKPEPKVVEEPKEEEEEEEQDDRLDSFKTFLFALKFKQKMSDAQNATKLRETKVQLQGTIANAQKMMGDDFEVTKKLEEEKEFAEKQVHYIRRLVTHIQMNESATYQLRQLRSEKALGKARLKAGAQVTGTDDEDEAVLPKKSTSPSKSTSKAVKGGKGGRNSKAGTNHRDSRDSPKRGTVRSGKSIGGMPAPRNSWLMKASDALTLEAPKNTTKTPRKSHIEPKVAASGRQSPMEGVPENGPSVVFDEHEDSGSEKSSEKSVSAESDSSESGMFVSRRSMKQTLEERKAQFNRLFTSTMQRRLRTATDKGAAMIFRKSLLDAGKSQDITTKILESKRVDLQNLLRLTLQRFGLKTNHRIQSAKEQQERWDAEVAYLNDKLCRGNGMASFWQDRYEEWLEQMGDTFGSPVLEAFVHEDRKTDRDKWSQRLREALFNIFEEMREETPGLAADVSRHLGITEQSNERTGTSTVRLRDMHMAKLMSQKKPEKNDAPEIPQIVRQPTAELLELDLPEPRRSFLARQTAIPARPMRQPGVNSAALRLPKMPIILQPEEEVDLAEAHSKSTSNALAPRHLPPWLKAQARRKAASNDLEMEADSEEVSESEIKHHISLERRRSVQPWVESVEWIEDVSYRAALKSLQKQFYRGKTQEDEAWGFPEAVHHRPPRKKLTDRSSKTLDRVAERNLSKKMHGFKLQEFPDPSFTPDAPPGLAHPTLRSLRRARARQARRTEAMKGFGFAVVANLGAHFRRRAARGQGDPPSFRHLVEPSVATSGTEATEAEGLSTCGTSGTLRRLRRFRRRLLKRFAGPEEAYNFIVTTPIGFLDYEAFCQLAAQISFDLEHTRMVWEKIWELLGKQHPAEEEGPEAFALRKGDFSHAMSFANRLCDLTNLRIRLELRYGSLSRSFDQMDRRHLDEESWNELLTSVGASAEEAKLFFTVMMANCRRPDSLKISRRNFLLLLRNAEGFAATSSLFHTLKLSNAATAWRTLMEHARRTGKRQGLRTDRSTSVTATDLQMLLTPICSKMHCEALLRFAFAKRQRDRISGAPLLLEELLLVAVAGIGLRFDELRKELGRDYDGEESSLRQGPFVAVHRVQKDKGSNLAQRLRSSVVEAATKLQRGEAHQGSTTLLGIIGKRPPSHVRSYNSSDTEDLPSMSSRSAATSRHSSPRDLLK